eukprot:NODE_7332_length_574_cov_12.201905_g6320_i0.p1 GENE.NODE_7332_length_574_cov_12.201905_g6320_i0~~NODE_7332_length_574_cov_12.201905_g6320_i0.p1  ORF type:complete len:100 (-),score=6.77 NODE_7332_length_574_cov_12.201905_g6320_i0:60-359(-)
MFRGVHAARGLQQACRTSLLVQQSSMLATATPSFRGIRPFSSSGTGMSALARRATFQDLITNPDLEAGASILTTLAFLLQLENWYVCIGGSTLVNPTPA